MNKFEYRKIEVGTPFQFVDTTQLEVLVAGFSFLKYLKAVFTRFSFKVENGFTFGFKTQTFLGATPAGNVEVGNNTYIKIASKEGMPYNLVIGRLGKRNGKLAVIEIFRCKKSETNVRPIHAAQLSLTRRIR